MDFWAFCRVGVTEMSTNWSAVVDVGDEEHSESNVDGDVGLGMTVGEVAVAEDNMVHSLQAEIKTRELWFIDLEGSEEQPERRERQKIIN